MLVTLPEKVAFKRVTTRNWMLRDDTRDDVEDGTRVDVGGIEWIEYVNAIAFPANVPHEVRDAFRSAAGAIGYAYFYHPIFTLASQQILRVADYAVEKIFDVHGIAKPRSFAERLERLKRARLITESEFHRWDGIRRLRNGATHADWQEHWGEAMSLRMIGIVAEAISALPWKGSYADQ